MKTSITSIIITSSYLLWVGTAPVTVHAGIGPPPCGLVVDNTNDSGPGSLRDAVEICAAPGQTITFPLGPSLLNDNALAVNVCKFLKARTERFHKRRGLDVRHRLAVEVAVQVRPGYVLDGEVRHALVFAGFVHLHDVRAESITITRRSRSVIAFSPATP